MRKQHNSSVVFLSMFSLLLLVFSFSEAAWTQSTATLQGTVTDPSGAAVPKARIVIRNQATGVEWAAESNDAGNYLVPGLPVAAYTIEVTREGFQTYVVTGLKLDVATIAVQNIHLKLGEMTNKVVITAETPVIESSTISVGQVIDQNVVQQIPLNGRHIEELIQLAPGSVTPPQNGFLSAPLRGLGSFGAVTAGNREDTVNFLVNGINLNDPIQNQTTFQPSINTVSEFKLLNSTLSSEYGHTSGSVMSVVTRSGANDYHGEVFDLVRNSSLDARNFFNPVPVPQATFRRNNFGANFSGPVGIPGVVETHKAFFFYSFEGLRQRQEQPFNVRVPTPGERAMVTDPVAQQLLPLIPLPNTPGNTFAGAGSAPVDVNQSTLDLFLKLTPSDSVHAYFARQRDDRHEPSAPVSFATIPGFGDVRSGRRNILTLSETHIFSPSVVNEFRFGGNRIKIKFGNVDVHNPADFGFVGQKPGSLPEIFIQSFNLDFGGGGNAFPQGRFDTTYVWGDTLTWLRGNSTWKFGTEIRKFYNDNFSDPVGRFLFSSFSTCTNATTGLPVSCFTQGTPSQFQINQGANTSAIGAGSFMFFGQDSYKMRRNFTWDLGFRFEWNTTPTERFNRFVAFDPTTVSLQQINSSAFDELYDTSRNFEPRVGFAWDPFNTGKTVVRAGYGIFFDQPVTNAVSPLAGNPPFLNPLLFNNPPSFANPFLGTLAGGGPLRPSTIASSFKNSYMQQWNLNLEHQITPTLGVMVGYFGSKGTHLRVARDLNQPNLSLPSCPKSPTSTGKPTPFCTVTLVNGSIRPASAIIAVDSVTNSDYNALWLTANKRLSHGLQFLATYSFSHAIDYNSLSSQGVVLQDSTNPRGDRGSSDFDTRHRLVTSFGYDLPFRGRFAFLPTRFVEGWSLNGIATLQSGNPVDLKVAFGQFTPLTNLAGTIRPNIVGNPSVPKKDPAGFFNPLAFAAPPSGQFGNLGRNALIGPPFYNFDFSIRKTTSLTERVKVEFRSEFFNLFNHPNLGQPFATCLPSPDPFTVSQLPGITFPAGTCTPNASFGTITDLVTGKTPSPQNFSVIRSTRAPVGDFGSSRQVQFALKLSF